MEPLEPPGPTVEADRMADPHSFRSLMARMLEGSEEAARELQERYGEHVVRAVRRRLPRVLRPAFDSLDFVQDVWASFFRIPDRQFDSPERLVAFLTCVARNKVVDATRGHLGTLKRGLRREVPKQPPRPDPEAVPLFARDETPSQAAIGQELWEQMLDGQPPAYRQVLVMLRDGCTQAEVAERLKLNRRTVYRVLERALEKIQP